MIPYRYEMSFHDFYIRQLIPPTKVALMTDWMGEEAHKKHTYPEWKQLLEDFDKEYPEEKND